MVGDAVADIAYCVMDIAAPLVIAGPCAAESRTQVLQTAQAIAALGLQAAGCKVIFRAGVWKPRTSPDSFQGIGDEGLDWLAEVRRLTGMETATEAGTPDQVLKAAAAGIDHLWTGARTGASPILIQHIADAVVQAQAQGGQLKSLLVKNPMHEDAALWAGNIRRMQQTGLPVIAVHRGCAHRPCWRMAWQLRRLMPGTPMLIDPSHMSGERRLVQPLCGTAASLGYDGLMVEVHTCPEEALSDARQQITPAELPPCIYSKLPADDLAWLRQQIDEADDDIWNAVARRMDISREIGEWKRGRQMQVVQPERFRQVQERRLRWAAANGLSEDTVRAITEALHNESIRTQQHN